MIVLKKLAELNEEAESYNGCLTEWYRAVKEEMGVKSYQSFRNYFNGQKVSETHHKLVKIGAKVIKKYRDADIQTLKEVEAILQ